MNADSLCADEVGGRGFFGRSDVEHTPVPLGLDRSPLLTQSDRATLVDWVSEMCAGFGLSPTAFFLAVNYVDRVLGRALNVDHVKFELLGAAALLLAGKVDEPDPPDEGMVASWTPRQFDVTVLIGAERAILHILDWRVSHLTTFDWLCRLATDYVTDGVSCVLARLVSVAVAVEMDSASTDIRPSHRAAALLIMDGEVRAEVLRRVIPGTSHEALLRACLVVSQYIDVAGAPDVLSETHVHVASHVRVAKRAMRSRAHRSKPWELGNA